MHDDGEPRRPAQPHSIRRPLVAAVAVGYFSRPRRLYAYSLTEPSQLSPSAESSSLTPRADNSRVPSGNRAGGLLEVGVGQIGPAVQALGDR